MVQVLMYTKILFSGMIFQGLRVCLPGASQESVLLGCPGFEHTKFTELVLYYAFHLVIFSCLTIFDDSSVSAQSRIKILSFVFSCYSINIWIFESLYIFYSLLHIPNILLSFCYSFPLQSNIKNVSSWPNSPLYHNDIFQ